ncbi:MAG: hypothetical protein LBU09_00165 [Endomicrobium sp.]|jgi:hypothetical protein|nr:hypothetical protein [Endomicrobium sp.]
MSLKKFLAPLFAVAVAASFVYADIHVNQGDKSFVHPAGSSLNLSPSKEIIALSISHNGVEMNLNSQAAYSFSELKIDGRLSLQIDMFKNAYIEIGDTVITIKGNKAVLVMTTKERSNKVNIKVVSGKVAAKSHGSDNEREYPATSNFSIFDASEIAAAAADGASYKFEEDLTKPVSSSNP